MLATYKNNLMVEWAMPTLLENIIVRGINTRD